MLENPPWGSFMNDPNIFSRFFGGFLSLQMQIYPQKCSLIILLTTGRELAVEGFPRTQQFVAMFGIEKTKNIPLYFTSVVHQETSPVSILSRKAQQKIIIYKCVTII